MATTTSSKESKVIFEVQARLNCQTNKLKEQKRGTNEDLTEEVNLYRPQGQELEIVLSPKAEVRSNTS